MAYMTLFTPCHGWASDQPASYPAWVGSCVLFLFARTIAYKKQAPCWFLIYHQLSIYQTLDAIETMTEHWSGYNCMLLYLRCRRFRSSLPGRVPVYFWAPYSTTTSCFTTSLFHLDVDYLHYRLLYSISHICHGTQDLRPFTGTWPG